VLGNHRWVFASALGGLALLSLGVVRDAQGLVHGARLPGGNRREVGYPAPGAGQHVPRIRARRGTSSNWAGYAVTGRNVTDVQGSWTVPAVDTLDSCANSYSAAWLGIDGDNSNTVEQCGTDQDYINGVPQYYAWYEMYPKALQILSTTTYPVAPGDNIQARVQYLPNGQFRLTLINDGASTLHHSWSFMTSQKLNQARRTSAEWIMEAPWLGGVLPLTDFDHVTFHGCTATVGGQTKTLQSWIATQNFDQIDMVNGSGGLKAMTNPPTAADTFAIDWQSCPP
jgi:Peptidase A4 family